MQWPAKLRIRHMRCQRRRQRQRKFAGLRARSPSLFPLSLSLSLPASFNNLYECVFYFPATTLLLACPAPSAWHAHTLRPVPGEFLQFVSTAFQIIYRILNDAQVRRQ